jgi:quercetin dioxygenase-like cupin family protein
MNLKELHQEPKPVSAISVFKTETGNTTAIQIAKGETLKEHITRVPALLVCVAGQAFFENERGFKITLTNGDYITIEPMVKHWVNAIELSQLILIK